MLGYLALVAPGTPLRDGFERILRGRTGALVVLGHGREVQDLCTGGFELDVPFTKQVVDLMDAAQRAAFLQIWPIGKFPVLRDEARDLAVKVGLVP